MRWAPLFLNCYIGSMICVRLAVFFRVIVTDLVWGFVSVCVVGCIYIGFGGVRMYAVINLRRYRAVEEVGEIIMNVRTITFYQLMQVCQRDPRFLAGKASPIHGYEMGGFAHNTPVGGHYADGIPLAPAFDATLAGTNQEVLAPLNRLEFQTFENCPMNFIIFDRTNDRSRVMFNPALANKFSCPKFNIHAMHGHDEVKSIERNNENDGKFSSLLKEDTEEIDALLSSDEDEEDDVISTGRTPGNQGGSSPDSSCSLEGYKSRKLHSTSQVSFSGGASSSKRKRERMKKMVSVLRGIIPGGESMDTPVILDEAIRYLKSLKVEVEKLGPA